MKSLFLPFTGQIDGHVFCIPSTTYIYCLILVIPIIISIVLLSTSISMDIHSVLDTDQDQERRRRASNMNLAHKRIIIESANKIFVCDTFDTTGLNLSVLFAGKAYQSYHYEGHQGYIFESRANRLLAGSDGSTCAGIVVLDTNFDLIRSRGSRILSGTREVEVLHSYTNNKKLLIKEH